MQERRRHAARRNGSGQTMIELVVVIFIILTAIGGIAALVTVSVRGENMTEETVIAYNLAREGVELARALRDNSFTSDLRSPTCTSDCQTLRSNIADHDGIVQTLQAASPYGYFPVLNYDGSISDFSSRGTDVCLRNSSSDSRYYYNFYSTVNTNSCQPDYNASTGNAGATRYKRRIQVDYICVNPVSNTECVSTGTGCGVAPCATFTLFAGHKVTSWVQITNRRGGNKNVSVEDYLYAWK